MLPIAMLLFAVTAMPATLPQPVAPTPFLATYAVDYRGFDAGLLHFELIAEEAGRYVYDSYAEPSALAKLVVGGSVAERSVMRIDAAGVRPLSWFTHDGVLRFDWEAGTVGGVVEGARVDLPAEPKLQDRLSMQIAVMTALLRGDEPGLVPMVDEDEIKRYSYARAGFEEIRTPAGTFAAVLYESTRPGSSRLSRVWHAPALGYLPVRVEQLRRGRIETVLQLVGVAGR